jgi:hypothetical protein
MGFARTVLYAGLLLFAGTLPALASVPCHIFGAPDGDCPNPISEGVVDGQWIALIFHYGGTNGEADSIGVVSVGYGGNGALTGALGTIKPEGQYGDRMSADFVDGKLWVKNAIYLPGEGHCCFTRIAVRQFGFHDKKLRQEVIVTVPAGSSQSEIKSALRAAPQSY